MGTIIQTMNLVRSSSTPRIAPFLSQTCIEIEIKCALCHAGSKSCQELLFHISTVTTQSKLKIIFGDS